MIDSPTFGPDDGPISFDDFGLKDNKPPIFHARTIVCVTVSEPREMRLLWLFDALIKRIWSPQARLVASSEFEFEVS
jgi:hypothetical protein